MNKINKGVTLIVFLALLAIVGYGIYQWLRFNYIDSSAIFFSFLALSYLVNWVTWGEHNGGGEKDEMDRHIELKSAKLSYFILMILAALVLFSSEGFADFKDIDNYPLLIVVGLTFVTLPITEFFYSKRLKS